jgi:hypothetical protein
MTANDPLQDDLAAAYSRYLDHRRARRRRVRVAAIASAAALVVAGAAFGTATLLGWPAPEHVKKEIAAVDRGLPEDLRLNPDVETARAVASDGSSTLYAASLKDGGSCTELVTTGDRGRGATCATASREIADPINVVVPFDDGAGEDARVVLAGRLNDPAGTELEITYVDGGSDPIPLGDDRYFVYEVPAGHRASAHADGFELVAQDDNGSTIASTSVPPSWDDAAVPDDASLLYVGTRSDESDFTKVYGLEGHVSAEGANTLELRYSNGETVQIPIRPDGSFEYTVPADRVDDFMDQQLVVARDQAGRALASRPVAAVAYWRGRERGH